MRILYTASGFLAGILASAFAWTASNGAAVVDTGITEFTPTNVTAILQEIGATAVETRTTEDGTKYLGFAYQDRKYTAFFQVCPKVKDSCFGLDLGAVFTGATVPLATVNAYNMKYAIGKAAIGQSGALISERYIIADGGVSRINVTSELVNFFRRTDDLLAYLKESAVISSIGGPANTVAYSEKPAAGGLHFDAGGNKHANASSRFEAGPTNALPH